MKPGADGLGMGSSSPPRVLEAWAQSAAQGRVQRVAIAQFEVVEQRQLLRTHWAQLSVWLEPRPEAQETSTAPPRPRADLTHWPGLAGRGRLLALMDTAAPWKQVRWGPGDIGGSKVTRRPVASESACFSPWWPAALGTPPSLARSQPPGSERQPTPVHQQTSPGHPLRASPAQACCKDECWVTVY